MNLKYLLTIFLIIWLVSVGNSLMMGQQTDLTSQEKESQQGSSVQQATGEELAEIDSGYTYEKGDKRDPFIPLKTPRGTGSPGRGPSHTGKCPAGCLISEMELKGIVRDNSGIFFAIFIGPDKKSLKMKVGDRFFDGEIMSIDLKKVVLKEEVQDPTEIIKFREVIKLLHPTEGKVE